MSIKNCTIRLLNKSYDMKCPEAEYESLQQASRKLNDHMIITKKQFAHLDEHQVLLLAALNIARDLTLCQKQQELQRHQVAQLIDSLENRIHQVVSGTIEQPV